MVFISFMCILNTYVLFSMLEDLEMLKPTRAVALRWYLAVDHSSVPTPTKSNDREWAILLDHRPP